MISPQRSASSKGWLDRPLRQTAGFRPWASLEPVALRKKVFWLNAAAPTARFDLWRLAAGH